MKRKIPIFRDPVWKTGLYPKCYILQRYVSEFALGLTLVRIIMTRLLHSQIRLTARRASSYRTSLIFVWSMSVEFWEWIKSNVNPDTLIFVKFIPINFWRAFQPVFNVGLRLKVCSEFTFFKVCSEFYSIFDLQRLRTSDSQYQVHLPSGTF